MRVLFRSVLLTSVLLGACSSGPKYKRLTMRCSPMCRWVKSRRCCQFSRTRTGDRRKEQSGQ